jgi:hypothetical protein
MPKLSTTWFNGTSCLDRLDPIFIERGSSSSLEKGERETKRESVIGGGVKSQEQVYNMFARGYSSPVRKRDG